MNRSNLEKENKLREEPVTLATLCNGALLERFDVELSKVCENIMDINTDVDTVREIQIKVKIRPDDSRRKALVTVQVVSKIGALKAVGTEIGIGSKGGRAMAVETNIEQLTFFDQEISKNIHRVDFQTGEVKE